MRPLVFAGPSLYGVRREVLADIDLCPPAGCGDIARAAREGFRTIGLIDGTFEAGPAVWHKEILYALSLGCNVWGAASMGALRAAECRTFGMAGVGKIFDDYSSGRRHRDADVALVYGPAELDYPPLSISLVDVDDALQRMLVDGVINETALSLLQDTSRRTFFKDRTWEDVLETTKIDATDMNRVLEWLACSGWCLKTQDALELIGVISGPDARGPVPYRFESTQFFDQLHIPET